MGFKHVALSALVLASLSSMSAHADQIGWGNGQDRPGQQPSQPSFPSQPNRPSQPSQPSFPSQPSRPTQPSFPSQPQDPWGNNGGLGSNDPWGNSGSQVSSVEDNVQRYFNSGDTLDLLSDYYTLSQLQGQRIHDIVIVMSSQDGNGLASLVLNGQSLQSSRTVARPISSYSFSVDQFANVAGQSLRTAQLYMRGNFYVEKVIFNLSSSGGSSGNFPSYPPQRPPQSGPQIEVVRQQVNQQIQQEGGLELSRLFNLAQRQGQVLRRVTLIARSMRDNGQASLLVNGQQASMMQGVSYNSRLSFDLSYGARIGLEIQQLKLYFRGDIIIDEVDLEFEQSGLINNGGFGGRDDHDGRGRRH